MRAVCLFYIIIICFFKFKIYFYISRYLMYYLKISKRCLWHLVMMCNNYYINYYIIRFIKNLNLRPIKSKKEGCGRNTHNIELYDKHYFDTLHIFWQWFLSYTYHRHSQCLAPALDKNAFISPITMISITIEEPFYAFQNRKSMVL